MVNVWGSKYSSRNKAIRDADDNEIEQELVDRNWEFMPNQEYQKLLGLVGKHKYGMIDDERMLDEVYRLVGLIKC